MTNSVYLHHFQKQVSQAFLKEGLSEDEAKRVVADLFEKFLDSIKGSENETQLKKEAYKYKTGVLENIENFFKEKNEGKTIIQNYEKA